MHRSPEKSLFDRLPFLVFQRAVVNKDLRDRTVEGALRKWWLAGIIGINAATEHDLSQADFRSSPVAIPSLESIQKNFSAHFPRLAADRKNMKVSERSLRRIKKSGHQHIAKPSRPSRLNIQDAQFFRRLRPEIDVQSARVIILRKLGRAEHPRKIAFIRFRRSQKKDRQFLCRRQLWVTDQHIIFAIKPEESCVLVANQHRPTFWRGLNRHLSPHRIKN